MAQDNNIMSVFKRDNAKKFKVEDYTIKNKTHLIMVAESIHKFKELENKVCCRFYGLIDHNIKVEYEKLSNKSSKERLEIIQSLMIAEKVDKNGIRLTIEEFLEQDDFEEILKENIKSREDGLNYAVALGVIDDYIEFLLSGKYSGPITKL